VTQSIVNRQTETGQSGRTADLFISRHHRARWKARGSNLAELKTGIAHHALDIGDMKEGDAVASLTQPHRKADESANMAAYRDADYAEMHRQPL
jgi:hypothetical protein